MIAFASISSREKRAVVVAVVVDVVVVVGYRKVTRGFTSDSSAEMGDLQQDFFS